MKRTHGASLTALLIGAGLIAATPVFNPAAAQSDNCAPTSVAEGGATIVAQEPPPPLPDEEQPPIPAPGYLWTPGYWYWNNTDYYYVPGTWVEPPHPGLLWTPGFWAFAAGVYHFTHGYWGPHVGFYGGVPYGHGYDGSGYLGGRWTGNTFFYNRTVNNISDPHITNVYNETVNHFGGPRISYNGGPGGIAARPTAEEAALLHGPHEAPTPLQVQHLRAAGMVPGAFAGVNQGHPAVSALRGNIHDAAAHQPSAPAAAASHPEPTPPRPAAMAAPHEAPHPAPNPAGAHPEPHPGAPAGPHPAAPTHPTPHAPMRPEVHAPPHAAPPPPRPAPHAAPPPHPAPPHPAPPHPAPPHAPPHEPPHAGPHEHPPHP